MTRARIDNILDKAESIYNELVDIRRHLHQIPELAYEEFETSKYIQEQLRSIGVPFATGIVKTGIVASLGEKNRKKTIALRADIDALPVEEKTGLPFSSKNEGKFHACGHDMHTTCLLGALKILKTESDELPVNVKAIFQPAEEAVHGGAEKMIQEGILKNPDVSEIFGLHMEPFYPTGTVAVKAGPMMASTYAFDITIKGKGGHAAKPFTTIDPIVIAAHVVTSLQSIVSRATDPLKPCIVSVTGINAGSSHNIIPSEAYIKGTARALNAETDEKIPKHIEQIVKGVTAAHNAHYAIDIRRGSGMVINDDKATEHLREVSKKLIGENNVREYEGTFGGEDFASYLEKIPGCFFRLGCSNDPDNAVSLHNPTFTPDEKALIYGSAILAGLVLEYENK